MQPLPKFVSFAAWLLLLLLLQVSAQDIEPEWPDYMTTTSATIDIPTTELSTTSELPATSTSELPNTELSTTTELPSSTTTTTATTTTTESTSAAPTSSTTTTARSTTTTTAKTTARTTTAVPSSSTAWPTLATTTAQPHWRPIVPVLPAYPFYGTYCYYKEQMEFSSWYWRMYCNSDVSCYRCCYYPYSGTAGCCKAYLGRCQPQPQPHPEHNSYDSYQYGDTDDNDYY